MGKKTASFVKTSANSPTQMTLMTERFQCWTTRQYRKLCLSLMRHCLHEAKTIRKNYILWCSKNTILLTVSHCTTLRLEYDVQLVCTKSQGQSFLKYNKLHTYITLTPFFGQLTDDKMCSYFMQDNVTDQTANF